MKNKEKQDLYKKSVEILKKKGLIGPEDRWSRMALTYVEITQGISLGDVEADRAWLSADFKFVEFSWQEYPDCPEHTIKIIFHAGLQAGIWVDGDLYQN